MPDREQQIHPPSARPSTAHPLSAPVADVVFAPRRRTHDPEIANRLRHGLLRRPLGPDAPLRW